MKNSLRLLAFVLAAAFAAVLPARASGIYFKAAGLYSSPQDLKVGSATAFKGSLKNDTGLSGAIGYKIPFIPIRAEAELQWLKSGFEGGSTSLGPVTSTSGDYRQFTGFVNGYYDLPTYYGFGAYLGAGLGMARIDLNHLSVFQGATNVVSFSGKENAFAYQLMVGLSFHLLGQASLNAGYRLVKQESIALTNSAAASALQSIRPGDNRIFELGVTIGF